MKIIIVFTEFHLHNTLPSLSLAGRVVAQEDVDSDEGDVGQVWCHR